MIIQSKYQYVNRKHFYFYIYIFIEVSNSTNKKNRFFTLLTRLDFSDALRAPGHLARSLAITGTVQLRVATEFLYK